uniref:Uncharacterized protein n=1 Tax=Siphoviridae sp. ctxMM9 TaxID=2827973 RepID=A0A8S5T6D0_9CAUD|nr:MAG TPA: hypothetical protein [Siphoviridae sp. ctxMM9]
MRILFISHRICRNNLLTSTNISFEISQFS